MAIDNLQLDNTESAIPSPVANTIADAWETIQGFQVRTRKQPVKGFHPSDFEDAYQWLFNLRSRFPANARPRFCEWGSGFGVISYLAQCLGYNVTAIESDPELFQAAQHWQGQVGATFTHLNGSFIPPGFLDQYHPPSDSPKNSQQGQTLWLDLDTHSVFEPDNPAASEFDLVYAYPWPGEEEFIFELFDYASKPGALLLTFHGAAEFRLHQKTRPGTSA